MEDDVASQLPDPPPSRPAKRAAAIASALERVDEAGARATGARPASQWRIGRTRIGAFASIILVALIGIPLALEHPGGETSPSQPTRPVDTAMVADRAPVVMPRQAPAPIAPATSRPPAEPQRLQAEAVTTPEAGMTPAFDVPPPTAAPQIAPIPIAAAPPPPPPPPSPPPPAKVDRFAEVPMNRAASMARAPEADAGLEDVVVTGSRVNRQKAARARRGDWNVCTINDPEQSLRGCEKLILTRARGNAGAAAELSQGLALAWEGDTDGAIGAFDRAIAIQPRFGVAYLNRGLVYQRIGDIERAAADLNLAVRYDPSALSYYSRATIRRQGDDRRGARTDEARAIDLNADYEAVVGD